MTLGAPVVLGSGLAKHGSGDSYVWGGLVRTGVESARWAFNMSFQYLVPSYDRKRPRKSWPHARAGLVSKVARSRIVKSTKLSHARHAELAPECTQEHCLALPPKAAL